MTEWSLWMKHNPHALARPGWVLFEPADLNVAITPIAGPSA